jgi:hypothetical protein
MRAGHRTTCSACGLCRGRGRGDARSIVIIAHGLRTKWFRLAKAADDPVRLETGT